VAPRGLAVFDSHLHVIDPRFPLVANQGYLPEPFTVEDYRAATTGLDLVGGAVVSGSFQAFDQTYLVDALARLGPGFVGVTQLRGDETDEEIRSLDAAGVRAVRFNLHRGGELDERLALRVHDLVGWHTEVYAGGPALARLEPRLRELPRLVVDHLGLDPRALPVLLRLGAHVKASGFGRVALDVEATVRTLDPTRLLFGSDLPGTRARRPFEPRDLRVIERFAPQALAENARAWYRPRA
jgi:predicted TIM-barrel fold metal-dependent hydrolase